MVGNPVVISFFGSEIVTMAFYVSNTVLGVMLGSQTIGLIIGTIKLHKLMLVVSYTSALTIKWFWVFMKIAFCRDCNL